ncbi:MAG: class I SAM-dependent methyltransferase [Bacteroidetes bacterium]|nr:class I SAM-dependent methyltransferase [Bacteroidota bacterium]MDA0974048.1 class I SAM-dependent methyltransferase [Bacteroidota bacterium]
MSKLAQLQRYLHFRKGSLNRHGVHSPFVFEFIEKVLRNRGSIPEAMEIEAIRRRLLKDRTLISTMDPGAGSTAAGSRSIQNVAKRSLSSRDQCRILYRIVKHFTPSTVIEFGTCLGISTAYLSAAGCERLISMEGHPDLFKGAEKVLSSLDLKAELHEGLFDASLDNIINDVGKVDMAFIDGHHTEEATLHYYDRLRPHLHENSVIIFDDIHWSDGMERAWETLKRSEGVTLSIDLFWCGLLFFKKGLSGEHFKLHY